MSSGAVLSTVRPSIVPYRAEPAKGNLCSALANCNLSFFECYSADYTKGSLGLAKTVVNPFFYYRRLLELLKEIPDVEFLTMEELVRGPAAPDKVRIAIRHDIDGDIVTARMMAELERKLSVRTTYYVLHTAPYYGVFQEGLFRRFEFMGAYYRRFQELGHEVGLHTDPLFIYQEHQMDGAQGVRDELAWLRARGLRITGTAAHNHYSVYGAQNFEIFKGRFRNFVMPGGNDAPVIREEEAVHNGKWAPLHQLDERELGLAYEGHDAFAVPGYLGIMAEIGYDLINQTWNMKTDHAARGLKSGPADFAHLASAMSRLRRGDAVIFTTHDLYYGQRADAKSRPPVKMNRVRTAQNRRLGWRTYRPQSVAAVAREVKGKQVSQSINFANEFGMLSKPVVNAGRGSVNVLLFGGGNLDAPELGLPAQFQSQLEKNLAAAMKCPVQVRSFSRQGFGVPRYAPWYLKLPAALKPAVVLLGAGRNFPAADDPGRWSGKSGSGNYLAPAGAGRVRVKKFLWRAPRVRAEELLDYAASCYRTLAEWVRNDGGAPYIWIEEEVSAETRLLITRAAAAAGLEILDPHPALARYEGPGACSEDGRWTSVGHRVAADYAARQLIEKGLVVRP